MTLRVQVKSVTRRTHYTHTRALNKIEFHDANCIHLHARRRLEWKISYKAKRDPGSLAAATAAAAAAVAPRDLDRNRTHEAHRSRLSKGNRKEEDETTTTFSYHDKKICRTRLLIYR